MVPIIACLFPWCIRYFVRSFDQHYDNCFHSMQHYGVLDPIAPHFTFHWHYTELTPAGVWIHARCGPATAVELDRAVVSAAVLLLGSGTPGGPATYSLESRGGRSTALGFGLGIEGPIVHNTDELFEGRQHVVSRLGRGLEEFHPVLLAKGRCLFLGDLPAPVEIALVSYQQLGEVVRVGVIVELRHPSLRQRFERLGVCDVVDQNDTLCLAEIGRQQDPREAFLSGRVPDLCLDLALWRIEHLCVEFDPHRCRNVVVEGTVGIRQPCHQRGLSNARVTEHDDFVKRGLSARCGCGSSGHGLCFVYR
mmetsp:Transcript_2827/g.6296  ORF Transcript_2827/g.6296 Transcript_2827/m.6296 type:complete len:307 (-) Transcript_2827:121-1041(-)